jgi:hypothetical protein
MYLHEFAQVAQRARQLFYKETAKPDAQISLAKACMLIALEEEAAAAAEEQESRGTFKIALSSGAVQGANAQDPEKDLAPRRATLVVLHKRSQKLHLLL